MNEITNAHNVTFPVYRDGLDPRLEVKSYMQFWGWDNKDLSEILGVSVSYISMFLNNKTGLTVSLAQKLSIAFYSTMEEWMLKEIKFKAQGIAKKEYDDEIFKRMKMYKAIPVRELIRRGWISQHHTNEELLSELRKYLGRDFVDEIQKWLQNADLVGEFHDGVTETIREKVWMKKAIEISSNKKFVEYNHAIIQETLNQFCTPRNEKRDVVEFLSDLIKGGVHFYVLPNLTGIYILGALLWHGSNPTIVYTLENKDPDTFCKFIGIISNLIAKYIDNPQHSKTDSPNDEILVSDVLRIPKIYKLENDVNEHQPIKGKHVTLIYARRVRHSITRFKKGAISKHSFIPYEYYAEVNLEK